MAAVVDSGLNFKLPPSPTEIEMVAAEALAVRARTEKAVRILLLVELTRVRRSIAGRIEKAQLQSRGPKK